MKNTRITTFLYKLGFFISFMLFNFTLLSATEEVTPVRDKKVP